MTPRLNYSFVANFTVAASGIALAVMTFQGGPILSFLEEAPSSLFMVASGMRMTVGSVGDQALTRSSGSRRRYQIAFEMRGRKLSSEL